MSPSAGDRAALAGRIALVTGGGRGIGRAISLALAQAGASVAVNFRRDEQSAKETVAAIEADGGRAGAYRASVVSWEDLSAMTGAIAGDLGPIDILVNNAGIASRGLPVADTDPAEFERVLATHAIGAALLSKLVIPQMRTKARGDIVMISSVAVESMAANGSPYNMGKAALEALARTLAKEEAVHGIRVNIVASGLVVTDMGDRLARAAMGAPTGAADLDKAAGLGRVSRPSDIAATVLFLVSPSAMQVTGQRLAVDGGGLSPARD